MHDTALINASKFLIKYKTKNIDPAILDVGSYDVNGSLKPLLTKLYPRGKYIGIDIEKGPNVDLVYDGKILPFDNESFDLIVSTSCFEHDYHFWETFAEMVRVLKKDGIIYINAPSAGPYHCYPIDCWRFYADSWKGLAKWCREYRKMDIEIIESYIEPIGEFHDSVGVFKKITQKEILEIRFQLLCSTPSTINEHCLVFRKYGSLCEHITNCGHETSLPFIVTYPKKLTDVGTIDKSTEICVSNEIEYKYYKENSLTCPIESTDLLFISTWHVYGQLKRELERWNSNVRKYIIMHATAIDADEGETIRMRMDAQKQRKESGFSLDEINKGTQPAIDEFLIKHPEWKLIERFMNNNGVTILGRSS